MDLGATQDPRGGQDSRASVPAIAQAPSQRHWIVSHERFLGAVCLLGAYVFGALCLVSLFALGTFAFITGLLAGICLALVLMMLLLIRLRRSQRSGGHPAIEKFSEDRLNSR